MNGYDPQTRRGGFWPTEVSPVDGLLGAASPTLPEVDGDEADILQESEAEASSSQPDGTVRPFETPPVEMTDENADRLRRLGLLVAMVSLVAVIMARRRRRRQR